MRKSLYLSGLLALVLILAACGNLPTGERGPDTLGAQSAPSVQEVFPEGPSPFLSTSGEMVNETPAFWFVEFSGPPTVRGGSATVLRNQRAAFRSAAAAEAIGFQERFNFERLFNGLSVVATPAAAGRLGQLPGVVAIWPVDAVPIPEPSPSLEPDLLTALAMTGADTAQSELGLTGRGIRVAVIDSGIDYNHPDLGGGWGNRVVAGWDFVGDAFNAGDPANNIPRPGPSPMDCNGHGTHVAGIVGASGAVTGVAPEVTFGAYKVFGCVGSTFSDIIIAAMERALADGMHIVNMSLGAAFQWPQFPTAVAANNLVRAGVVVVASIGNSGAQGVFSAGAPGVGADVIGVASFDNTHVSLAAFRISPDNTLIGYGAAAAAPPPPTSGSHPMVRTGTPAATHDACERITQDLSGHVALIRRGGCPFHTKALNAQNAGAAAVVLYNHLAGRFSATVVGTPAITIPVVAISDTEGVLIDSRLATGPVTMTWTDELLFARVPTGGLTSSFSSFGLAPDLTIKPDIGAPGGLIRSTYPLALGGYATLSGTSMSAPHVAGAAALLLQARPRVRAEEVRGILQNSATPVLWWGHPGLGFLDNVHRQGSGMLNIPGAVLSTTSVTPSMLHLGESEAGPATRTLTIRNTGASAVTYTLSFVNALSTGGSTFSPDFFGSNASVAFSQPSVTVSAGGRATVTATITAPTSPNLGQYGGYIVLTPQGGGQVHRVPFAGFIGDYQALVAMPPTVFRFPWLARLEGAAFVNQPDGARFTMQGGDVPYFLLHFAHQAQFMEMNILHADTRRPVHPVFHKTNVFQHLPRNATATGFFAFDWDGTRIHSNMTRGRGNQNELFKVVPNGDYVITIRVLKALGNPNNPAHWETWTSPRITIARP
ncbi:MAG: S8 family serine peptidase [Truepera sp.]|nr:S8 family serine peptidase [Truepera sp.]